MFPPLNEADVGARQQGAALIVAILVCALATLLAVQALASGDRWLTRFTTSQEKTRLLELARTGTDFARMVLAADARQSAVDTLHEFWAMPMPQQQFPDGEVGGRILDLQGRFNLNNLWREGGVIDEQAFAAYQRLLAQLGLSSALADTLADWLDADSSPRAQGAEEGAGNRRLLHFSELSRVTGYSPAVIARLAPMVWVETTAQPVNVNTAPAEILVAIQPGLSLAAAQQLVASRAQAHFVHAADYRNRFPASELPDSLVPVVVGSGYFLIEVEASGGLAMSRIHSQIRRDPGDGKTQIRWQSVQ